MSKSNQKSLDIEEIKSRISPLHMFNLANEKKTQSTYELNLIQENLQLRNKIDTLEEKCKKFE